MSEGWSEGFDAAVLALRSWARGFHGGTTAATYLWAAAGDLERNKEIIAQGGVTEGRDGAAGSGSEATSTRSAESGCAQTPSSSPSPSKEDS